MKDYQKSKLYRWQREYVYPKMPKSPCNLDKMRSLVNYMWKHIGMIHPPEVHINPAYKTKSTGNRSQILMSPNMCYESTLTHEMAHSLNMRYDDTRFDWHGPNFVADFMTLLVKFYRFDPFYLLATAKKTKLDVNEDLLFQNVNRKVIA